MSANSPMPCRLNRLLWVTALLLTGIGAGSCAGPRQDLGVAARIQPVGPTWSAPVADAAERGSFAIEVTDFLRDNQHPEIVVSHLV